MVAGRAGSGPESLWVTNLVEAVGVCHGRRHGSGVEDCAAADLENATGFALVVDDDCPAVGPEDAEAVGNGLRAGPDALAGCPVVGLLGPSAAGNGCRATLGEGEGFLAGGCLGICGVDGGCRTGVATEGCLAAGPGDTSVPEAGVCCPVAGPEDAARSEAGVGCPVAGSEEVGHCSVVCSVAVCSVGVEGRTAAG